MACARSLFCKKIKSYKKKKNTNLHILSFLGFLTVVGIGNRQQEQDSSRTSTTNSGFRMVNSSWSIRYGQFSVLLEEGAAISLSFLFLFFFKHTTYNTRHTTRHTTIRQYDNPTIILHEASWRISILFFFISVNIKIVKKKRKGFSCLSFFFQAVLILKESWFLPLAGPYVIGGVSWLERQDRHSTLKFIFFPFFFPFFLFLFIKVYIMYIYT